MGKCSLVKRGGPSRLDSWNNKLNSTEDNMLLSMKVIHVAHVTGVALFPGPAMQPGNETGERVKLGSTNIPDLQLLQ